MNVQNDVKPSAAGNAGIALADDFALLNVMLADAKTQPSLYQPGVYWAYKARNAANEIKRCGLGDFRGATSHVGLSFADNVSIDIRNSLNYGLKARLIRWATQVYPLSRIYDAQVRLTESYATTTISYAQEILNLQERTKHLLAKYRMPYSLLGKCMAKAKINGKDISVHYLNLLDQHDHIASRIRFADAKSVFEIGGGFGASIHLLLANYPNIRKVFYLDIPPNLYVGTQYLRAFYGEAVIDYQSLRLRNKIEFSPDNKLEILCIAPWQIERVESSVDIFLNSHSFVEMPTPVVQNYVAHWNRLPGSKDSAVALATYDCFDLNTTFHPNELPKMFADRSFESFDERTLLTAASKNLFFVSPGSLSVR